MFFADFARWAEIVHEGLEGGRRVDAARAKYRRRCHKVAGQLKRLQSPHALAVSLTAPEVEELIRLLQET